MNELALPLNADLFSKEIILNQADKIMQFRDFAVSGTLRRFLSYIVHETLSGRETDIKEHNIALYVLRKKMFSQSRSNGVVRVHARRLRVALKNYYLTEGQTDECEITVPVGRYRPVFLNRKQARTGSTVHKSVEIYKRKILGVEPFRTSAKTGSKLALAARISESLSMELSKISTLSVVSPQTTKQLSNNAKNSEHGDHPNSGPSDDYGIQYMISGQVYFEPEKIMVLAELTDVKTKIMLWTYKSIFSCESQCPFETGEQVVQGIRNNLHSHSGLFDNLSVQKLSVVNNFRYPNEWIA